MEFNLEVMIKVCNKGFTTEIMGRIQYVNPINHQLYLEVKPGEYEKITLENVVDVVVVK
ncbi:YolD-like family protein [Neobacillus niacini]|uniref:YolD-like family protein n=1 Tax=Neobacillus niacini TaxID=86668 RepID=UPI00333E90A7